MRSPDDPEASCAGAGATVKEGEERAEGGRGRPQREDPSQVRRLGPLPVKFQLALQYMPVRPTDGQQWNIQDQITPVTWKLVKRTIFE